MITEVIAGTICLYLGYKIRDMGYSIKKENDGYKFVTPKEDKEEQ